MEIMDKMSAGDRAVLAEFARRVREFLPEADIRAFGSRARGTAQEDSDLDICVVDAVMDHRISEKVRYIAWEVGFDRDMLICTVTFNSAEITAGPLSESPLVLAIREEGIAA